MYGRSTQEGKRYSSRIATSYELIDEQFRARYLSHVPIWQAAHSCRSWPFDKFDGDTQVVSRGVLERIGRLSLTPG